MNLPFDSPFKAVLRSRNYLFLAPAPVFFAPAPASFPAALYCHFKMYYSITVVTYEICLNGGTNEFLFILAGSNLTLIQSIFFKQIISASTPDPQNKFGSTGSGSATLPF